jgi:hypothetical protein
MASVLSGVLTRSRRCRVEDDGAVSTLVDHLCEHDWKNAVWPISLPQLQKRSIALMSHALKLGMPHTSVIKDKGFQNLWRRRRSGAQKARAAEEKSRIHETVSFVLLAKDRDGDSLRNCEKNKFS